MDGGREKRLDVRSATTVSLCGDGGRRRWITVVSGTGNFPRAGALTPRWSSLLASSCGIGLLTRAKMELVKSHLPVNFTHISSVCLACTSKGSH